jgi:hypothetical protein
MAKSKWLSDKDLLALVPTTFEEVKKDPPKEETVVADSTTTIPKKKIKVRTARILELHDKQLRLFQRMKDQLDEEQKELTKILEKKAKTVEAQREICRKFTKEYGHEYADPEKPGYTLKDISLVGTNFKSYWASKQRKGAFDEDAVYQWSDTEYPEMRGRKFVDLTSAEKIVRASTDPAREQILTCLRIVNELLPKLESETGEELVVPENRFNDELFDKLKEEGKIPAEVLAKAEPVIEKLEWDFRHLHGKGNRCDGCAKPKTKVEQKDLNFVCKRCGHK